MLNTITNDTEILYKKTLQNPENIGHFQSLLKDLYYLENKGKYKEASRIANTNFQFKRALKNYEHQENRNKNLGNKLIHKKLSEFNNNELLKRNFNKYFLKD